LTTKLLAFQVLGLSLGVMGWCLENSDTSSYSWRVHSHSQAVTTNNWQFEGLSSCLLTGSSLANDYWKMSSVSVSVIVSTRQFQNLFHSCAENSAGIRNWKDFESMLALPGFFLWSDYIQACRALMIIALLLGLASIIVSVRGLKCTEIGSTSEQVKGEITLSCGSLFILSGLSTLTAVSWYAARVVQEFHDPFLAGVR
ncbi:claudin-15-like, partial [Oncorhynchus mykiss]|uniref:claudin-15-like n=1 Tax=Oncorhynchus mykiss TaxID=8022 RepID=UPI001878923A